MIRGRVKGYSHGDRCLRNKIHKHYHLNLLYRYISKKLSSYRSTAVFKVPSSCGIDLMVMHVLNVRVYNN